MLLDLSCKYTLEKQQKIEDLHKLVERSGDLAIGKEEILLAKFLNYAAWDVERAYESLRRYYDFKALHPTWVAHHPVQHFRDHFMSTLSKFIMPKPDKNGRAIVVSKSVDAFDKYPDYLQDIIEMDDLIFESLLLLPRVQQYGVTIIFDLKGTTRNFLRVLSPSVSRLINEKNNIMPFSTRIVHLIQSGFMMNAATALVMPFLSRNFKEKIFTHDSKNLDKLREMVGYENLPAEYGGPIDNVLDVNILYNHLLRNAEYLLKLQSYKKITQ